MYLCMTMWASLHFFIDRSYTFLNLVFHGDEFFLRSGPFFSAPTSNHLKNYKPPQFKFSGLFLCFAEYRGSAGEQLAKHGSSACSPASDGLASAEMPADYGFFAADGRLQWPRAPAKVSASQRCLASKTTRFAGCRSRLVDSYIPLFKFFVR